MEQIEENDVEIKRITWTQKVNADAPRQFLRFKDEEGVWQVIRISQPQYKLKEHSHGNT